MSTPIRGRGLGLARALSLPPTLLLSSSVVSFRLGGGANTTAAGDGVATGALAGRCVGGELEALISALTEASIALESIVGVLDGLDSGVDGALVVAGLLLRRSVEPLTPAPMCRLGFVGRGGEAWASAGNGAAGLD